MLPGIASWQMQAEAESSPHKLSAQDTYYMLQYGQQQGLTGEASRANLSQLRTHRQLRETGRFE